MKNTRIDFQWIAGGKEHNKILDRQKMYSIFNGLAEGYAEDENEISTTMVNDVIPYADKISINRDYNETQDIPMISYEIARKTKVLKIKRYHKIIWAILDRYCTE